MLIELWVENVKWKGKVCVTRCYSFRCHCEWGKLRDWDKREHWCGVLDEWKVDGGITDVK